MTFLFIRHRNYQFRLLHTSNAHKQQCFLSLP